MAIVLNTVRWLATPLRAALGQERAIGAFFSAYWTARTAGYRLAATLRPGRRPRPRPRIAVLSMWDDRQADLGAITGPNKARYCRLHGYDWLPRTGNFVSGRPVAWSKLHFLREILPAYDWVFWSDADSLVMDLRIPLESLVDQPADLLITRDHIAVNSGSFLLRNCAWSRAFLDEAWAIPDRADYRASYDLWQDRLWENRAFWMLLRGRDHLRHTRFIPQRRLNSYLTDLTPAGPRALYHPGDFVLHLPGVAHDTRLRVLADYAHRAAATAA